MMGTSFKVEVLKLKILMFGTLRFSLRQSCIQSFTVDCKRMCGFPDISNFFFFEKQRQLQFQMTTTSTFDRMNVEISLIEHYNDDNIKLQHLIV